MKCDTGVEPKTFKSSQKVKILLII